MKGTLSIIIIAAVLVSCGGKEKDNPYSMKVKFGQTPAEVIRIIGKPDASSVPYNVLHSHDSDSLYWYMSEDSVSAEIYFSNGVVNSVSISAMDSANIAGIQKYVSDNFTYFKKTPIYTVFIDGKDVASSKTAVLLFCPENIAYLSYYGINDCEYTKEYVK